MGNMSAIWGGHSSVVFDIVIGILVVALLIYRQLRTRRVNSGGGARLMLILGLIGVVQTGEYLSGHHVGVAAVAELLGSLVLAAVFAALRAVTVRIWIDRGVAWAKGGWLTAALWIVTLGAHLGYDALTGHSRATAGLGAATILLYLAVSLGVQRVITGYRARRLDPGSGPATMSGSGPLSGIGAF